MPLTAKGQKILNAMEKSYNSKEKAEQVFYASANKGTITGVHDDQAITDTMAACADAMAAACDAIEALNRRIDAYTARRADEFHEQPAQDIKDSREDDRRVIGGIGHRLPP